MPGQMTPITWGQGAKNALICGIALLVLWCVMAWAVSVISRQPISDSFRVAFAVCYMLTFLVFLVDWLYGRVKAGRLLLDCGPQAMRSLFLISAGVLLILVWMERDATAPMLKAFTVTWVPIFDLSSAGLFLIFGTGRLQLRENGIWQYSSLLRWDRIASYRWVDDSTLIVSRKGLLGFFKGALPIPPEHRQTVEGVLMKQCPTGRLASQ